MLIPVSAADFDEQTITLHIEDKKLYDSFSFYFGMKIEVDITQLIKGSANFNNAQHLGIEPF